MIHPFHFAYLDKAQIARLAYIVSDRFYSHDSSEIKQQGRKITDL